MRYGWLCPPTIWINPTNASKHRDTAVLAMSIFDDKGLVPDCQSRISDLWLRAHYSWQKVTGIPEVWKFLRDWWGTRNTTTSGLLTRATLPLTQTYIRCTTQHGLSCAHAEIRKPINYRNAFHDVTPASGRRSLIGRSSDRCHTNRNDLWHNCVLLEHLANYEGNTFAFLDSPSQHIPPGCLSYQPLPSSYSNTSRFIPKQRPTSSHGSTRQQRQQ